MFTYILGDSYWPIEASPLAFGAWLVIYGHKLRYASITGGEKAYWIVDKDGELIGLARISALHNAKKGE